jgi:hypothetical protein
MEIKIISEGKEVKPEAPKAITPSNGLVGDVSGDIELKAMGQVMGLERDSEIGQNESKLRTLLDYAKSQTKDHSPENLKWIIRSLELKLGTPPLAEKRISYVTRYAYILGEESRIKAEKEKFERKI